jgi:hypothetical protein
LTGYSQTPGSLHFDPERGLPTTLVRKLLKARQAELAAAPRKQKPATRKKKPPTQQRARKKVTGKKRLA